MFAALTTLAALTILDVSKVGVALPSIQAATGGTETMLQLMLVGYTIAYAAALLPAGRLGDVVSRRVLFLLGAGVFVAANLLCAISPNIPVLVAGRIIQGIGAGILMPQVFGLIQISFPPLERAKPLAILAAVLTVTSLVGPVLAGVELAVFGGEAGWRAVFGSSATIGLLTFLIATRKVKPPASQVRHGFDAVGAMLIAISVISVIAPISLASGLRRWENWMSLPVALGLAVAVVFGIHEARIRQQGREPLVDLTLFKLPHFGLGFGVAAFMHAAATAGMLIVTMALQQVAGLTPLQTALVMLPAAVAGVAGSAVASRISATNGPIVCLGTAIGMVGHLAAASTFALAPPDRLHLFIVLALAVSSFGSGLSAPANQARSLAHVPEYRSSIAGSLIQFAQRIGSAFGMAFALVLYFSPFSFLEGAPSGQSGTVAALILVASFLLIGTLLGFVDVLLTRHRTEKIR